MELHSFRPLSQRQYRSCRPCPRGKIVFLSDQLGEPAALVMDPDGSDQHNISNNEYNDWDPVWIK